MKRLIAVIMLALPAMPSAFAQPNQPPLLIPVQPAPPPPPLAIPTPVPQAFPPPPPLSPGYGTPRAGTSVPLSSGTLRSVYRPDYRKPKKKRWKKPHRRYESAAPIFQLI